MPAIVLTFCYATFFCYCSIDQPEKLGFLPSDSLKIITDENPKQRTVVDSEQVSRRQTVF